MRPPGENLAIAPTAHHQRARGSVGLTLLPNSSQEGPPTHQQLISVSRLRAATRMSISSEVNGVISTLITHLVEY
jgi:hypothetical protein